MHAYSYATKIRAEYLEKLTRWSGFEKAFLMSSGTEATEAALKLMRLHGQKVGKRRPGIFCIEGNYHGRTMGAQMMSGGSEWIGFHDENMLHLPFPYPWKGMHVLNFEALNPNDICGVMLETYQGWCAAFYPPDYVQAIARFCEENNVLLCFDEMQSGFGRTGKKFGYEHYGVTPDLICIGKGMGGGLPLSGVLGRADIMDLPEVGEMSSTHSANPLCCAAGLAVIEEIERLDLVNESARKGINLYYNLGGMKSRFPQRVDHILEHGLVAAIIFRGDEPAAFASRVAERCMEKGLIVVHTGRESIKIGPPLTISDDALIEGVSVLGEAIAEIDTESK